MSAGLEPVTEDLCRLSAHADSCESVPTGWLEAQPRWLRDRRARLRFSCFGGEHDQLDRLQYSRPAVPVGSDSQSGAAAGWCPLHLPKTVRRWARPGVLVRRDAGPAVRHRQGSGPTRLRTDGVSPNEPATTCSQIGLVGFQSGRIKNPEFGIAVGDPRCKRPGSVLRR